MKKTFFLSFIIITLASGFVINHKVANSKKDMKQMLKELNGTYQDVAAVDWGKGTFGVRRFTFNKGKWTLHFTLALDPAMKNQVFVFSTTGSYKVLDKSPLVANAYNALFLEDKKFVTLKTADEKLIQGFGLTLCGLVKDIEKDISITGCSLWKPVKECNEDHDLLSLDKEGKLYFGVRPPDNNMCSAAKRPTQLNVPVVKIK
jgi:hypothetical protein